MTMFRAVKERVHILFKSSEWSPNNNNTLLREAVLIINKIDFKGKMPWYFTKLS